MSKISGLLVLMAGVGMVAYALPSRDTGPSSVGVAPLSDGATAATSADPRTFSPQHPLVAQAATVFETAAVPSETSKATVASRLLPTSGTEGVQSAPALPPKPSVEDARRVLARDLQQELKRVGCYDGEISGAWNAQTRKAMSAFIARVNATLPVEQPDYILLTLLQGHVAKACGTTCASGTIASADGRCVPNNLITAAASNDKVEKKPASPASASVSVRKKPLSREVPTTTASSSWQTTVAPSATVAAVAPPVSSGASGPLSSTAAPLPGRMAIGAAHVPPVPPASITVERNTLRPAQPIDDGGSVRSAAASKSPELGPGNAQPSPVPPRKVAAVSSQSSPPSVDETEDVSEELRRNRQARQAAQREEARREDARERARRAALRSRQPVIVYRSPGPIYSPAPRVYRSTPSYAGSSTRNWKHAIFNDITRMR
jgi:hypothetical protein